MSEVFDRLDAFLRSRGLGFHVLVHAEAKTSQEAARIRGLPIAMGAKALALKLGREDKGLFVFPANLRLRSTLIRKALGIQRLRFLTSEELKEHAGLVPGEVPPFGEPILALRLYVHPSLLEQEYMVFTAGRHDRSILLRCEDYRKVADIEQVFAFAVD